MKTHYNVPIQQLTTFQNQGTIHRVVTVGTVTELQSYLKEAPSFTVIGKGSNMVISSTIDQDLLIISPTFTPCKCDGGLLTVGAGVTVNQLMKMLIQKHLTGLEFMAGVPASVGGMVAMNFGCWGRSISDTLQEIQMMTIDGQIQTISNPNLHFSYRYSDVQAHQWIVLSARFKLNSEDPAVIQHTIESNIQQRLEKQPLRAKTFGSVFKNPPNGYAAQLIESLGLKGHVKGQVKISEKHANFFVNLGNATFNQLQEMIHFVQEKVHTKYGIMLETEVKLLG